MTIRGSFHVRSERLDPLSQTGFSMASTCVWRCIASPLFPSRKRIFYTHPHARTITCTLGRVCSLDTRVHTWARYPISYCTETPHWGRERENERKGVTKSGELSKLSRLSRPDCHFDPDWNSPSGSHPEKLVAKGGIKPGRVFAENSMIDSVRPTWITSDALYGKCTLPSDFSVQTIIYKAISDGELLFVRRVILIEVSLTYKRIHTECFKTSERHFNSIDSLINLNNHWQQ